MQHFVVVGRMAGFGPGAILGLSKDQFERRVYAVRKVESQDFSEADQAELSKDSLVAVEVVKPVQFKLGEDICLLSKFPVNKAILEDLAPANSPTAKDAKKERQARKVAGEKKSQAHAEKAAAKVARQEEIKKSGKGKKKPSTKKTDPKVPGTIEQQTTDSAESTQKGLEV